MKPEEPEEGCNGTTPLAGKRVTRREFLKITGVAGVAVGMSAGLGGLVAACGEETETTTTAGGTTTTAGATTTTAGATTTVSAAELGREIKIGFVTPLTGPLAAFGVPDQYSVNRAVEAIGDGIVCGDGQKHPISIITSDCQSDSNRAAQVAGDLINNNQVDMLVAASTPDTVSPVADQAEAGGVPCLTTDCPWQSFVATRTGGDLAGTFKWTYNVFWGAEDQIADFTDMWQQLPTNNIVGAMFPNDADGNALGPIWREAWEPNGLTVVEVSGFQPGTEDYTAQISQFKKAGCEIGYGIFSPPDMTNFWKQSVQQGWIPKIPTYAKALLFPQTVDAMGSIANNVCAEVWWTPSYPFTSQFLGQNCQEFAADYEAKTGQQWTQPLMHFLLFEWAVDVLKRTKSVDDPEAIIEAVAATNLETIAGVIDFTAPVEPAGPPFTVGPCHIHKNVYKSPLAAGQWRTSTKYPFDLTIVGNKACPMVAVEDKIRPYTGS